MTHSPMLQPMVALIAWTLAMLAWMLATRLPAMRAAGIDMATLVGTTGTHADRGLPANAQWKAHNYNHLMEQPTLFYAVCAVLAILGTADGSSIALGWGYVALRVAHSLVQATSNRVRIRFVLFILSSLCLVGLTLRAAAVVAL